MLIFLNLRSAYCCLCQRTWSVLILGQPSVNFQMLTLFLPARFISSFDFLKVKNTQCVKCGLTPPFHISIYAWSQIDYYKALHLTILISKIIYAIDAFTDYYFKKSKIHFIHSIHYRYNNIESSVSAIRTQIKTVSLRTSDFHSFSDKVKTLVQS